MKIKMNQAASVNGGAYKFKPNQVVSDRDYPAWVLQLLLGSGYADPIVPEPARVSAPPAKVSKPKAPAPAKKPAAVKSPTKPKPSKSEA